MNLSLAANKPDSMREMTWPSFRGALNPSTAIPIALVIWSLAALGDFLTTAEVGFTLLYLVPIGIVVWWKGIRPGLLLAFLCTGSFLGTWIATTTMTANSAHYLLILAWNLVGEIGVFLTFAIVLNTLRKRLEVEVSEKESAVVQLRHADRLNTVGKLASGIAHELGTPLNVVSGRASLIAARRVTGDDACKSAEIIMQQTDRITAIIQNLLAFARRGGTRKASQDLVRLVRETASLLEPLAKKQGVQLVIMNESPHIAPINAGELQQVLTNLIMNAVQAMPEGGAVHIEIEQELASSSWKCGITGEAYAHIRVRDDGIGIPPDVLPHVFDPFFTTKDVGTGTGLGLSITYGIVRDHGGWIDVESTVGKGSEFSVFLPQFESAPVSTR